MENLHEQILRMKEMMCLNEANSYDPEEFFESVKNLLSNIRHIHKSKYKLDHFLKNVVDNAKILKHTKVNDKKIDGFIEYLTKNFDKSILSELGLVEFLKNLKKPNKNEYIDDFVAKTKDVGDDIIELYKENLKKDKKYDIFNVFNGSEDMLNMNQFFKKNFYLQIELLKLQEWIKENNKKVLVIFEGRDAAGKSANIEAITENLNPKHFRVESFGIPTEEEKKNWFKRYEKVLPKEGELVLFDRSWYNRGIIEPAMGYCSDAQYEDFMKNVQSFEEKLHDKGYVILKIWLDITKDKQEARFEMRKRDPLKYWKFSENDQKIMKKWNKLTPYIKRVLEETNHSKAPWFIISSDDKLNGIVNSMKTILNHFDYNKKDYELFKKVKNLIFLDLHGVLITDIIVDADGGHDCNKGWDSGCIGHLNHITDVTNAKIVIISHCKDVVKFKELKANLRKAGVTGDIIGKTVSVEKNMRAHQIQTWFKEHGEPKNWIVLDDKFYDDYATIPDNWIQTKTKKGLTDKEAKEVIKKFE